MKRADILEAAKSYFEQEQTKKKFIPGETYIPPTGKVLDGDDCLNLVDASLDMWLTSGRFADEFETNLAAVFGRKHSKLTVSGSAANLLAFSTLTSWKLGEDRLKPGDEVITVSAGFPTTVAPIIQNRCIPVFVDIDAETHNVDTDEVEAAIGEKTKAVMLAHSLGNPFDAEKIASLCEKNGLYLIEDCCDAFGATLNGKNVGTFGELATLSFYPAHHITMGEGGAVLMDRLKFARICESFRDWGRDCHCKPGVDNTCGKRFGWQLGELPFGYDHKYTYSHLGYNLKVSDMQAAIGVSQLKKLKNFVETRRNNFEKLDNELKKRGLDEFFYLPKATPNSNPSWFGYLLTCKGDKAITRNDVIIELEQKRIGTRLLFGGDLTKQPAFQNAEWRISGKLKNTEKVMNDSFWIGVWPGINEEMIHYMVDSIETIMRRK